MYKLRIETSPRFFVVVPSPHRTASFCFPCCSSSPSSSSFLFFLRLSRILSQSEMSQRRRCSAPSESSVNRSVLAAGLRAHMRNRRTRGASRCCRDFDSDFSEIEIKNHVQGKRDPLSAFYLSNKRTTRLIGTKECVQVQAIII